VHTSEFVIIRVYFYAPVALLIPCAPAHIAWFDRFWPVIPQNTLILRHHLCQAFALYSGTALCIVTVA